jgi:hypothetical protein
MRGRERLQERHMAKGISGVSWKVDVMGAFSGRPTWRERDTWQVVGGR